MLSYNSVLGLSFSSVMCECLFLSSLLNLLLRDYHTAEKAVENGLHK